MTAPSSAPASQGPSVPRPASPFDPHAFPADLVTAQRTAAELFAAREAFQSTPPWSREPHPGWPEVTDRGKEARGRPASPGWTAEEDAGPPGS